MVYLLQIFYSVTSFILILLDKVEGVQTVKNLKIGNLAGEINGYSEYAYDVTGATLNGVIYPSIDPMVFELKFHQKLLHIEALLKIHQEIEQDAYRPKMQQHSMRACHTFLQVIVLPFF